MPFPILRSPFIVLSEIISFLDPNEIVTASFCSKNVQRLLERHYQRRKPVEWRLVMQDYDSRGRVKIRTSENGKGITIMSVRPISELSEELQAKAKRNGYMLMFNTQFVTAYMENQMMTAKSVVNTIRQLFNLDVFAVVMDTNGTWAIDWINNRQEMILGGIEFYRNPKDHSNADETVDYVLRNARFSLYCNIDGNVSDNFKFNGKLGPMRQLWIKSNGHWVTCDNLMNFDSITILIEGSRLSVSDLNSFLRHWRAGASARLEYLRLIFEEHTFIERFDEELEVVKTDEKKIFRRSSDEWEWKFQGGYSIQRLDGVKAMIQCGPRWLLMGVCH